MELLEERIRKDGKIYAGDVLKVDSFLNHHKHGWQYKDYDYHTYQRSPCHQDTQRTDHINVGIKSDSDGRCEEA